MNTILLLFGGQSSEHTVSCKSAASMIPFIDKMLFTVYVVGITRSGKWYLTEATPEEIASEKWEELTTNKEAFLSPNRSMSGLQVIENGSIRQIVIDVVLPVMHGELCEDGAIQGLFELCGIPYVGPNICASACCMDKSVTKRIVEASGIAQAQYILLTDEEIKRDLDSAVCKVEQKMSEGYPFFVKPASAGSSVGITKAHNRNELIQAFDKAICICNKVLIEETIIGREVEVAILGNNEPVASCVGEVLAANEFYDYNAKYNNISSKTIIPAKISTDNSERLRKAAIKIYRILGCEGMSRVDFFLLADDEIIFNEVNTFPGFTQISMYPKLFEASGISYQMLITRLCNLAIERGVKM